MTYEINELIKIPLLVCCWWKERRRRVLLQAFEVEDECGSHRRLARWLLTLQVV